MVIITGDVLGSVRYSLERLLVLPSGCGEQNMIHFAPNIYVLKYLDFTNQLTDVVRDKAIKYLLKG